MSASLGTAVSRALGPLMGGREAEVEAAGRLPDDIAAKLVGSGLCKLMVATRYGGFETPPRAAATVIEELSYHDSAVGWCAMIAATSGLLSGFLPEEGAAEIFGPDNAVVVGRLTPQGTATPAEGGARVSGMWQWGSFAQHATALVAGCTFPDGSVGLPVLDAAQVHLIDNWRVLGLGGTGSGDFRVDDAFVAEHRWASLAEPVVDTALFRIPPLSMLAMGIAAVSLGIARRAVAEFVTLATVKLPQGSSKPLAERAPVQADVSRAEAGVDAARLLLLDAAEVLFGDAADGPPSVEARRRLRLAASHATEAAARAVDLAYTAGGGAVVHLDHPLQRLFRDVHVTTQHAMVAPRTLELTGRLRFGLATDVGQL